MVDAVTGEAIVWPPGSGGSSKDRYGSPSVRPNRVPVAGIAASTPSVVGSGSEETMQPDAMAPQAIRVTEMSEVRMREFE